MYYTLSLTFIGFFYYIYLTKKAMKNTENNPDDRK